MARKTKILVKDPKVKKMLNSKKRIKIRKKKIKRHQKQEEQYQLDVIRVGDKVDIGVKGLKLSKVEKEFLREILEKLPKRKKYIKEKCNFVYDNGRKCGLNAIGHSKFCKLHGGSYVSEGAHDILTGGLQAVLQKNSKFNPAQHPMDYIKYSKLGFSDIEIAAEFEISHGTLMDWVEKFQIMGEAYEIGQAMYESWWLKKGVSGLDDGRNFNTSLYKYLAGNKLGYTEKVETGQSINNNFGVLVVPNQQSIEEWEKNGKVIDASKLNECIEASSGSKKIGYEKGQKVPVKIKEEEKYDY
jgi:hypothetical protein